MAFVLFVWICMKYIWPPMMKVLEEREKEISDGLDAANRGKVELKEAKAKREEILKEVCHVVAEHGAMITEQELTKSEMECLLAQWEELGCPTFSIKEAPIMVKFSLKELEKRLSR